MPFQSWAYHCNNGITRELHHLQHTPELLVMLFLRVRNETNARSHRAPRQLCEAPKRWKLVMKSEMNNLPNSIQKHFYFSRLVLWASLKGNLFSQQLQEWLQLKWLGIQQLTSPGHQEPEMSRTASKTCSTTCLMAATQPPWTIYKETNWNQLWGVTEWSSSTLLSNFLVNKNTWEREELGVPQCIPWAWFRAPNILFWFYKLEILSSYHRDQENCGKLYLLSEP